MKKLTFIAIVLASLGIASCKTTEANYKAAYDIAKSTQQSEEESDNGLNEETRRLLAGNRKTAKAQTIVGNDTIEVTTLFVKMEQGSHDRVPQYSVVLNAFTQKFNAQAMMQRLIDAGFTDAYVFCTSTPDYYVAADGKDDIAEIPAILQQVEKAGNLGSRSGFPAVIRSGGWRKQ